MFKYSLYFSNLIISNKFKFELYVDDLIVLIVQLFNAESPTPGWEDIGSFNLDGAMVAAKDIVTPYTQVELILSSNVELIFSN